MSSVWTAASAARATIVLAAIAGACASASAQAYRVRPGMVRPNPLNIGGGSTITLSASPAAVSFTLVPGGTVQASSGITVTTTWNIFGNHTTLNVYGYFGSASAALSDGYTPPDLIPSANVLGLMSTGAPTAYTAFSQATPFNGAASGLLLITQSQAHSSSGTRTDELNLEINLSTLPKLPAGTYTGTLTLQAQAN